MRLPLFILTATLIAGCAAMAPTAPVPPRKPDGPSALIVETATRIGNTGANFFFVTAIDDKEIKDTIMQRSLAASSRGRGYMNLAGQPRYVPAGKTRLSLRGDTSHAAGIDNLFRSKSLYEVSGTIEVELRDGATYVVVGVLDAMRREVWLVDHATRQPEGPRIVVKAPMAAPGTMTPQGEVRYTCCTLRYDGDWISDGNWLDQAPWPAGSPILVRSVGRNSADVTLDGRPMRIGLDYGRGQRTMQDLLDRLTTRTDPRTALAGWSEWVRAAVRVGRVIPGMTRDQVVMALGYPYPERTPSLDAEQWIYLTAAEEAVTLVWNGERLADIRGPDTAVRRYVMAPGATAR